MSAPITTSDASTVHDALVLSVAERLLSIAEQIAQSVTLDSAERAQLFGALLDDLAIEHGRVDTAREQAFSLAGAEVAERHAVLDELDADEQAEGDATEAEEGRAAHWEALHPEVL